MTDHVHWKRFFTAQQSIQFREWRSRTQHYAHDHDFIELVLITKGSGAHDSASGTDQLAPGRIILLTPGVWHEYRDCTDLSGWDCCLSKDLLYRELSWITDDPVLGCLLLRSAATSFHRKPVVGTLSAERLALARATLADAKLQQGRNDSGPRAFGVMLLMLGFFAEAVADQASNWHVPTISTALKSLTQRTQVLLADDLTREWTLAGLAQEVGVGPSVLSRAFRAVVGRAPMAYVVHSRMEHAAMLLLRTDLSIAEIGAKVGVFDANYFSRRFRTAMGMRPSDYRRRFQSVGE